ncbi:hypothetical protein BDY19DRAFT_967466 [Irpex rosettiformis]|uniref:Uncharacterized protein n=1 Tax=Irpex rosettiformis TaxID=378272 RepID=A0ACB8TT57_9APHY|nr:hypothetical protein BDY19DRAFT_967466 [Irpex rosettiformis]
MRGWSSTKLCSHSYGASPSFLLPHGCFLGYLLFLVIYSVHMMPSASSDFCIPGRGEFGSLYVVRMNVQVSLAVTLYPLSIRCICYMCSKCL